ncbi:hypothetical protein KRR55_13415 [Paeniglutamicibacter sp. ABSL32-1]|uniref:hypothetical protein n=1 Tax=Paeniglutamicibacter quisquiliarum TaxID=2849498 RepID=UPI001C2D2C4A|nr:hypothetical protein [Paeniglutamicibacter quisquiliarum]MBV1780111.1 hypothetical protein [Paeniglutamicibacter quisquiliarum]
MDQHPQDPSDRVSPRPRRSGARRALLALAAALAVAAGTLGTAVYLNRESPTWQGILGTEPVLREAPDPAAELPVLLDALNLMIEGPGASGGAPLAVALQGSGTMLSEHVDLLTPRIPEAPTASETSAGPSAATPPTPAEFSLRLAQTGSALLTQSLGAPGQEARRLSGAGLELLLQARTVLSASGATQAEIDALPAPRGTGEQAPATASGSAQESAAESTPAAGGATTSPAVLAQMPAFTVSGCPSPAPTQSEAADSGRLLAGVADAAYRMGYAYDVAGARTSAGLRTAAWNRSAMLVDFAKAVESQFAAELGCAPLRQPAYQLPADAIENPMDAARSGEAQLALLLRDAAATQEAEARAYLLDAAWAQALHARQVTGVAPDFTQVEGAAAVTGAATESPVSSGP